MSLLKECRSEGDWRAYIDGELAPVEMQTAKEHLTDCAACAGLLGEVERRAERVSALMGELDRIPETRTIPQPPALRGRRRAPMAILALAASLALAFLLLPRRTGDTRPVPAPAPIPAPVAKLTEPPIAAPAPAVRTRVRRRVPQPRMDYYLGLDSEPIETGMVVRVALDDGLLADVIVDEQGRPRAVRPVRFEEGRR